MKTNPFSSKKSIDVFRVKAIDKLDDEKIQKIDFSRMNGGPRR
jgi:hypothetical protein